MTQEGVGGDSSSASSHPVKRKQAASASTSGGFDREALRRFYMSPGKSFKAFSSKNSNLPTTSDDGATTTDVRASTPNPATLAAAAANRTSLFAQNSNPSSSSSAAATTATATVSAAASATANFRRLPTTVDTPSLMSGGGYASSPFPRMMNLSNIDSANTTVHNTPAAASAAATTAAFGRNNNNNNVNQAVVAVHGIAGIRNLTSGTASSFPVNSNINSSNKNNNQPNQQSAAYSSSSGTSNSNNNAASPEYLAFLRQQQDLLNVRGKVEKVIAELKTITREQEQYLAEQRVQGERMLHDIEASSNWNLRSKYDVRQLSKDCGLTLLQQELVKDEPAEISHMQALYERLHQLVDVDGAARGQNASSSSSSAAIGVDARDVANNATSLNLFVENAVRRIGVILDNLRTGNANCGHIAKASEPVITLLHTLCTQPTVEAVVTPYAKAIDQCVFELEQSRKQRESAYQDGEINSAEGLSYDIVEAYESMLEQLMVKLDALEKCQDEVRALTATREQVAKQTELDMENLFTSTEKMRKRCEDDIRKTFALREKVEDVEIQTANRMEAEHRRSDDFLGANSRKLQDAFARLQETFDEIENLERERHRELQRRMTEKDKDEHRRAEYAQFVQAVDEHVVPLERTLKNTVLVKSATDALRQLARGSFAQIDDALRQRESVLHLACTESHKQHVEAFRGYLIELGDVVAKKERMIDEVDDNIQQAIAQKEILTETFNPAAKKFGDIKKKLLSNRDELEQDVVSLKQRAGEALQRFQRTEAALYRAGISFVHPIVEQEHHAMEVQAKLMQYKALAIGHTEGNRLMDDITDFRYRLDETKREVAQANSLVSGTIGRTIPLLRAAAQQQQQRSLLSSSAAAAAAAAAAVTAGGRNQ